MKTKFKLLSGLLSVACGLSLALVLPSCSDSSFKSAAGGPQPPGADGNKSPAEDGNNPQPGDQKTEPGFAKSGKSLDIYVIMDKSGSLYVDPVTQKLNSGSDVACKRFDALLQLVDSLRTKLNSDEPVRLTVVTFSKQANVLGSMEQLLSQSRQQVTAKFRAGVCDNPDYDTTNYERGISATLMTHQSNIATKKMDMESIVFFSDGAARDSDTRILEESISRLNTTFPNRIYGVLLGKTQDKCVLKDAANGRSLQTSECMLKVIGNTPARLISVDDASGLSAAWADLVNR